MFRGEKSANEGACTQLWDDEIGSFIEWELVFLTVCCPGFTPTQQYDNLRASKKGSVARADSKRVHIMTDTEFNPKVVRLKRPTHHFRYLVATNGDWLTACDDSTLKTQGYVDDRAIWDIDADKGFKHVITGQRISASKVEIGTTCQLHMGDIGITSDGSLGDAADFTVSHGPEKLPSEYLQILKDQGWVSLTCALSPSVVDGLQKVGCVDAYSDQTPERKHALVQDAAVARSTTEPISLWLCRQYMDSGDIRLGHPPGVSALTTDYGQRAVQGWHTDFPYLWGTGDRIPKPSGDLVLGMQRNVCVSDFKKDNGATVFKLGTHTSNSPPPEKWGISRNTYASGHRAEHGLPYGGPETDVIEAPAGTIILYDARTWHRAGVNITPHKRGAIIQAIVPGFIMPFMDTSAPFKALLQSDAYTELTEREQKELDKLMVHKIVGPAGTFAITTDRELTQRAREQIESSR